MNFVHLHNHTHYSLLDGLTKIEEFVAKAKEDGATALAITDHGVLYGAVDFYQKCRQAGIKPIIGMEAYVAPGSRHDKFSRGSEKNYYHLLLLAKNYAGYKNLIKLSSIAHLEGFYYKPRVDWEILEKYKDNLIASTACLAGEIPRLILAGKLDKAKKRAQECNDFFGPENFYLEIMPHPELPGQDKVNQQLIKFSKELNIPLIATNDVHYLDKEDDEAQDVLLCLQNKKKKEDHDRLNMTGFDYSMRPAKEMIEAFPDVPEAITNTVKIADSCNIEIDLGNIQLPFFKVPEEEDGNSYLRKLCEEGLKKRYDKTYEESDSLIKERMDYELSVISKMGWPSYFLIVADFVNWAKDHAIIVGPGRGSAAGSLVCYLTGITNLDPLKYNLLFERFLNPDRISMPDIDLDFADARRDEVIRYVEEKYGKDHVAQIITFGTMAARAAIRDVGRVLGCPYDYCDRLAKMIPMFTKIKQALKVSTELKEIYEKEEMAKKIIDYARRLEGVSRHASTHACGVIITKNPLTDHVPLQYASSSDKTIVSQYSLHPIEDLGLLKMDFLGLKNLTIIESAINIIKGTRGVAVDIEKIPLDDELAYKLFQKGETTGVFQFESSGMKRYLRELKPTEFEDIIAMVALYRPGPMEWIPDYITGKQKRKRPSYLHPKLESILEKTYGVAIYQEQVMQMARDLAGFTMAEADVLRKAVGKKIPKLLAEQKEKFIDGCVKNGISTQLAEKIFSFIEPFAGYGFNRSHAACYAMIGYQTAYLKAHWPAEFMAALLTSDQQNIDRVAIEIEECRRLGIVVSRPDINQSFDFFTVVTSKTETSQTATTKEKAKTIRFGLKAIKNMGGHITEVIIKERKENGPFKDITDFLERVADKDLNRKSLESLIKSGALDKFGERGQLLKNIDNLLTFNKETASNKSNGQVSLFADAPVLNMSHKIKLDPAPPALKQEKLSWEKELLGIYISEHPFSDYKKELEGIALPLVNLSKHLAKQQVVVAGVITKIQKIITRSNEPMLFVKIEDVSANLEILVFPSLLKKTINVWQDNKVIICRGKLSDKDQEIKLLCDRAVILSLDSLDTILKKFKTNGASADSDYNSARKINHNEPVKNLSPAKISSSPLKLIFVQPVDNQVMSKLRNLFLSHQGDSKVYFKIEQNGAGNIIETDFKVDNNQVLTEAITSELGGWVRVVS